MTLPVDRPLLTVGSLASETYPNKQVLLEVMR
jgi:hypothetical protein